MSYRQCLLKKIVRSCVYICASKGLPFMSGYHGAPNLEKLVWFYVRSTQPFWAKGRSILFLVHLRAEDKIMIRSSIEKRKNLFD